MDIDFGELVWGLILLFVGGLALLVMKLFGAV